MFHAHETPGLKGLSFTLHGSSARYGCLGLITDRRITLSNDDIEY